MLVSPHPPVMPPISAHLPVSPPRAVVVGGGPAGLMAAEALTDAGLAVDLYDAMPSVGRKFLMAGKGGMNITHSEPFDAFLARYGAARERLAPALEAFGPEAVRAWMAGLGVDSFVGSSGRVFPTGMKAAPLLRAWLHRLRERGLRLHVRHRWLGLDQCDGGYRLRFAAPDGEVTLDTPVVVFALGGGSWAKLGSDGRWTAPFAELGVDLAPLRPANCGFDVAWSEHLLTRHAGEPVKPVAAMLAPDGTGYRRGEFVVSEAGIEGGLIYALAAPLRDALERDGQATLWLDLLPAHDAVKVAAEVAHPRGARSLSSHLGSRLGLKGVKLALVHECLSREAIADPAQLARGLKALPLKLAAPRPLDEAISTAGGVLFSALDADFMLHEHPGLYCAGEMLDWEAPTGGYLLTACLAAGRAAGQGAARRLKAGA